MDLSVVIVNWNTRDILAQCLASIAATTDDTLDLEVIVVDNGSFDGSADLVESQFPDVVLLRNDENRGFAAANNQAIAIARGRHILLLNSDTIVLDTVLRDAVQYMDQHGEVGCMGCRVLNADRTLQRTCFRFPSLFYLLLYATGMLQLRWPRVLGYHQMRDWNRESERAVEVVTGCFLLVRRQVFETVGLLDESFFFYGEETDFQVRARDAGWGVRFAPVGEIIHLGGASTARISDQRRRLLDDALVRLNRKHGGPWAGAIAQMMLGLRRIRCALTAKCRRGPRVETPMA